MARIIRAFVAGSLALLPIVLTIYVAVLLVDFVAQYVRPDSTIGGFLVGLGMSVDPSSPIPWVVGVAILFALITAFGLIVESRIGRWIVNLAEYPLRQIPVVGSFLSTLKRMTSIMDSGGGDDLKNMSPVWCFFGGDRTGAAVFGLLPTREAVHLDEAEYLGVLLPTAPFPIGGALIYVPSAWIEPADGAVDHLMSVYVSMGVQPPNGLKPLDAAAPPEAPAGSL